MSIELIGPKPTSNDTLNTKNIVYYPSTLKRDRFPIPVSNYTYTIENIEEDRIRILIKTKKQNDIFTFGIWACVFTKDDLDDNVKAEDMTEFKIDLYQHDEHWAYREISINKDEEGEKKTNNNPFKRLFDVIFERRTFRNVGYINNLVF